MTAVVEMFAHALQKIKFISSAEEASITMGAAMDEVLLQYLKPARR